MAHVKGTPFPLPVDEEKLTKLRQMLGAGLKYGEIARSLNLAPVTVAKYHRQFSPEAAARWKAKRRKWGRSSPSPKEQETGGEKSEEENMRGGENPPGTGSLGDKKPPLKASAKYTKSIDDAAHVIIQPKTFVMSSSLLWQAMKAAIKEWDWPGDITPEDFIDTYLYESFKQRGIILGGYTVLGRTVRGRTNGYQESFNGRVGSMVSGSEDELVETDSEKVYEDEEVE